MTKVVAAILKKKNFFLISSRPKGKMFENYWEFPGGKVEKGEYLIEALDREIFEELGVSLDFNEIYYLNNHKMLNYNISLHFFLCLRWFGKIESKEKQILKWIFPKELNNYDLLKSNSDFVSFLSNFIFPTAH